MKIISHKENRDRWNVYHEAIVETTEKIDNKEEFVEKVADKVGYNPAGYDCKSRKVVPIDNNRYKVKWLSYSHCD